MCLATTPSLSHFFSLRTKKVLYYVLYVTVVTFLFPNFLLDPFLLLLSAVGIDVTLSGKNLDLQLVLTPPTLFLALILVKKNFLCVTILLLLFFSFSLPYIFIRS